MQGGLCQLVGASLTGTQDPVSSAVLRLSCSERGLVSLTRSRAMSDRDLPDARPGCGRATRSWQASKSCCVPCSAPRHRVRWAMALGLMGHACHARVRKRAKGPAVPDRTGRVSAARAAGSPLQGGVEGVVQERGNGATLEL